MRYAAAAAVVGMTLAGCGGESAPAPPPMESPSASSTSPAAPSESAAAAPTLPPAAKGTSTAAAKAFVRHYFDVINTAMNSGDVTRMKQLATQACASCDAIADNIARTYAKGGSIRSAGWIVQSIHPVPAKPPRQPAFDLGVEMSPERVVKRAGGKTRTFRGGRQPMTIYLTKAPDGWRVTQLDRVA